MKLPILAEIERWIVEHGSAAVQKEHVALLQEKLRFLVNDVEKLEAENAALKRRNAELEASASSRPKCPVCDSAKFKVESSKPDEIFGDLGQMSDSYRCSDCGHKENRMRDAVQR